MKWKQFVSIDAFCIYLTLLNVLDAVTTYYGVFKLGLEEQNPIARLFFNNDMFLIALGMKMVSICLVVSLLWFAYNYYNLTYKINNKLLDKIHMHTYYIVSIFVTLFFVWIVVNNVVWIVKVLYG